MTRWPRSSALLILSVVAGALGFAPAAPAAVGDITTVAGDGTAGSTGDGGGATIAKLDRPPAAVPTPDGSFLIPDFGNNRVRRVSSLGIISNSAGTGVIGYSGDHGPAIFAELYQPRGVTATPDGGYLIADRRNHVIRKVSATGIITTVAGDGTPGYSGDTGSATAAQLNYPHALSLTPDGGFLIVDSNNNVIRKVSATGIITTVAGNGTFGYSGDSGPATSAELRRPEGVASLPDGGFLIADSSNNVVRKVSATGIITTVAGTGVSGYNGDGIPATTAKLALPEGIAPTSGGGFLVSDDLNNRIRKVSPTGVITTIVGNGTAGYTGDNGPAASAELKTPEYVAITPSGALLVADHDNNVIRKVSGPVAPLVAPPTVTTSPPSPSRTTDIRVLGSAPQGSQVALFSTPDCSGASLVSGSAASFHSTGFAVHVPSNATTTLHAVVYAAGGQLSSCSASTITYVEDSVAPRTTITKHPKRSVKTHHKRATVRFSFKSDDAAASFTCQLDGGLYRPCHSTNRYRLKPGHHTFRVRATDRAGNVGLSSAFAFKVVHIRKR